MTPQMNRLYKYLSSKGKITPIEAWQELGIYRLSDTILKLRKEGFEIETKMTNSLNKFQEKVNFATYILKGAK